MAENYSNLSELTYSQIPQYYNQLPPEEKDEFLVKYVAEAITFQRINDKVTMHSKEVSSELSNFLYSILGTLKLELQAFGWDEKNPFFQLLRFLNDNKVYNKTYYVAVHNLFANGTLIERDLIDNGSFIHNKYLVQETNDREITYQVQVFYWFEKSSNITYINNKYYAVEILSNRGVASTSVDDFRTTDDKKRKELMTFLQQAVVFGKKVSDNINYEVRPANLIEDDMYDLDRTYIDGETNEKKQWKDMSEQDKRDKINNLEINRVIKNTNISENDMLNLLDYISRLEIM